MTEKKAENNSNSLADSRWSDPPVFGSPIFPQDSSEYPVLVASDDDRAIVAVNRKTGYLLYRDGLAKSELDDLKVLEEKYLKVIAPGPRRWAMEAIGKPVPEDW